MRMSPEEMRRILGLSPAGNPPASKFGTKLIEHPPATLASQVGSPQAQTDKGSGHHTSFFTPAHSLLGRALPNLWRYAKTQPEAADARALHRKLRELMCWALEKGGFTVQTNVATPYSQTGATIEGRLELLVEHPSGTPMLAVETDWFGEEGSLLKLKVWHEKGIPALWILGRPCEPAGLAKFRTRANRTLRDATGRWLAIYHLDHGWFRARRP